MNEALTINFTFDERIYLYSSLIPRVKMVLAFGSEVPREIRFSLWILAFFFVTGDWLVALVVFVVGTGKEGWHASLSYLL